MDNTETFLQTVEAGSITGAATALGVDKSVVSRRLSALEASLGVKLLNRSSRGLSVTDAGAAYADRARTLVADWHEMEDTARGQPDALSGRIRIAAPLSFGLRYLGPALIAFARAHPDIELDVDFSDRKADLIGDGFDLAIRGGTLDDSALVARKLGRVEMVVAASPEWLAGQGPVQHPDDLSGGPELRYSLRPGVDWGYVGPDGETGILRMRAAMRATNGDFLRDAAIAGLGVVVEPDFIICDAVDDGLLVRLLTDFVFEAPTLYAVYPPTRHLSLRVRALIDELATQFGGDLPPWAVSG